MSTDSSQQFLRDLDKERWSAAGRIRANLEGAIYRRAERDRLVRRPARRMNAAAFINHAVLGLIFLKYFSDFFVIRSWEIDMRLQPPKSGHYIEKNFFCMPAVSRWNALYDSAPLHSVTEIEVRNGKKVIYRFTSIVSPVVEMLAPYHGRGYDIREARAGCLLPIVGHAASATQRGRAQSRGALTSREVRRIPGRRCENPRHNMRSHECK